MKNKITIFLLFVAAIASAQSPRVFTAKCNIAQSGSGSGYWQVAVTSLNDPGGLDATEIAVNDKLLFNDGGIQYTLNITTVVSAVGNSATIRVSNVGVTGISSVPTTSAVISRGTQNYGFIPDAANTSQNDKQFNSEYSMYMVDSLLQLKDPSSTNELTAYTGVGAPPVSPKQGDRWAGYTGDSIFIYNSGSWVFDAIRIRGGASSSEFVDIANYGGVGDGVTDNYDTLQYLVNTYPSVYISAGNFKIGQKVVVPAGHQIFGTGYGSQLSITANDTLLVLKSGCSVNGIRFHGNLTGTKQTGIRFGARGGQQINISVTECYFDSLGGHGIYFDSVGFNTSLHYANTVANCFFYKNSFGIKGGVRGEYVNLVNNSINNNTTGLYLAGGNVSCLGGSISDNTTGVRLFGGVNNGHTNMTNLKVNHNTNALDIDSLTLGMRFVGCDFFVGNINVDASSYIDFQGCNFQTNTTFAFVTSTLNKFINCEFKSANYPTYDATSKAISVGNTTPTKPGYEIDIANIANTGGTNRGQYAIYNGATKLFEATKLNVINVPILNAGAFYDNSSNNTPLTLYDTGRNTVLWMQNDETPASGRTNDFRFQRRNSTSYVLTSGTWMGRFNWNAGTNYFGVKSNSGTWSGGTISTGDFVWETTNSSGVQAERMKLTTDGVLSLTNNLLFTDNTYDIGASGATRPRTGYFGTSVVAPTIVPTNITGTATNNDASAGSVGEYVSSLIASGSAVSLTTATPANVTSISLTAGDWDVEGWVNYDYGSATVTQSRAGINTTSATIPTDGSEAYSATQLTLTSSLGTISLTRKRISIASTTTVYLVSQATFSAGTASAFGGISARRVR